ncbi:MAG: hypothetical protein HYS87_01495 [Candidatus Colwellbacteria bacterium]|nr:hypothetical protein [Candidatus Colwellbacteria bacterium]
MTDANPFFYLGKRFLWSIFFFFNHWYVGGFRAFSHFTLGFFERLDKTFALKVNLRNFFKPLYQDRSFIGYALGFVFRTTRLFITLVVYTFIFSLIFVVFLFWMLVPLVVVYRIIHGIIF